jgi:hypothetical protein
VRFFLARIGGHDPRNMFPCWRKSAPVGRGGLHGGGSHHQALDIVERSRSSACRRRPCPDADGSGIDPALVVDAEMVAHGPHQFTPVAVGFGPGGGLGPLLVMGANTA